jgi:hypothetical protein
VPARPDKVAGNSTQGAAASGGAKSRLTASSNPTTAKAASGGNSRKPTGNSRRSRAAPDPAALHPQRQPQHSSSSPPDAVPVSLTTPASNSAGALSLPTPHRRSRLSTGLLTAAAAAGGAEGRPAQTVMEVRQLQSAHHQRRAVVVALCCDTGSVVPMRDEQAAAILSISRLNSAQLHAPQSTKAILMSSCPAMVVPRSLHSTLQTSYDVSAVCAVVCCDLPPAGPGAW